MSAEEQAARAEDTPPSGEDLAQVIARARHAAARAGVEVQDSPSSLLSWQFHIAGLGEETVNAGDVDDLVAALEELPGVHARVIYPQASAWVSAPPEVTEQTLVGVFARFGLEATPTRATRLRLAQRARRTGALVRRHRRAPRRSPAEERAFERARKEGWLRQAALEDAAAALRQSPGSVSGEVNRLLETGASRDVLYTARGLITTPRLATAVVLTLPVIVLSLVTSWQFAGWQWLSLALTVPVASWCAWPFHRALAGGVRRGATALDGAGSLAVLAAVVWSLGSLFFTDAGRIGWHSASGFFSIPLLGNPGPDIFLDVACGITTLLLIGRRWSIQSRSSLVEELAAIRPDQHADVTVAQRRRHPNEPEGERMPLAEVNVGDDILVGPGQLVPVDGMVVGGSGTIEASVLSAALRGASPHRGYLGRHTPPSFAVTVGQPVGSGDRLIDGHLKVRVRRTGHATRIAAVERWVAQANRRQNAAVMLSTRSASWLIVVSGVLAVISFFGWWWATGNATSACATALAVLACVAPPALALSSALALRMGTEAGARHGLLLRDGGILRRLETTNTLVFNRVGSLTVSDMVVESVTALPGNDRDLLLRVAASLVADSDHPAARAIVRAARSIPHLPADTGVPRRVPADTGVPRRVPVTHAQVTATGDFVGTCTLPEKDAEGKVRERHVPARLWRPCSVAELSEPLAAIASAQGTPVVVNIGGVDRGVITLHDPVKPDAAEAVDAIESLGVETMMISRDIYPVARRFADSVGITRVLAGIAPGRKAGTVRTVHTQGNTVAMVGDASVSAALRVADVGVLVSETAPLEPDRDRGEIDRGIDVVVLRKEVRAVFELLALARRVCRIIDRNILFAWGYNAVALIAALAGLLHPLAATVAMLAASLVIEAASNRAGHAIGD